MTQATGEGSANCPPRGMEAVDPHFEGMKPLFDVLQ